MSGFKIVVVSLCRANSDTGVTSPALSSQQMVGQEISPSSPPWQSYPIPDLPGPTGIIPGGGGPIIGIIGGPPMCGAGIMPGRGGPAGQKQQLHIGILTHQRALQLFTAHGSN